MQELDRDPVRRLDEGHPAVARGSIDGDALLLKLLAIVIDIVDFERQMAEIAPAGIGFRIPVVGQFDGRIRAFRRRHEDEGVAARFILETTLFDKAELVDEEIKRLIEVRDSDHGVEVLHGGSDGG